MPNRPEELYNLVDVVAPGLLGGREAFEEGTAKPIKLGRAKDADQATIQRGAAAQDRLEGKLERVYIHRTKESELGEELPEKNETVSVLHTGRVMARDDVLAFSHAKRLIKGPLLRTH